MQSSTTLPLATGRSVVRLLDDFWRDLRYAVRMTWRTPGFMTVAVLSLALGTGAATAIATLFDAVLLRPLPVERPTELRVLKQTASAAGRVIKTNSLLPYAWFRELRANPEVFSDVLAFDELSDATLTVDGRPLRGTGGTAFVSDNYFTMLGVTASRGRVFNAQPADAAASSEQPIAVLADRFWRRELGADPAIVGRVIRVNDVPFTVIGVGPPAFAGLALGHTPDLFLPIATFGLAQPGLTRPADSSTWIVNVVGRLKPGVTETAARAQLTARRQRFEPPTSRQPKAVIELLPPETGLSTVRARFAQPLVILLGMVGLLLFIGCANVATMLLSRASARRTEVVIRSAIGAGQGRLLRQLATESLLLNALAAGIGIALASWIVLALPAVLPASDDAIRLDLAIDRRTLMFAIAIAAMTTLLSALAPALHTAKMGVASSLRSGARQVGGAMGRLGRPFLIAQIATALVLLVGAGLLARSLRAMATFDPGFAVENVVVATAAPGARGYDAARLDRYYREALDRLRAMPGTQAASIARLGFLGGARTTGTVDVPGFTPASEDERWVQVFQVGSDFFRTMGIAVLRGRAFDEADVAQGARVAAINETAARRYFGAEDPIGRTLRSDIEYRVIAVVKDGYYNTLREGDIAGLFTPYTAVGRRAQMTFTIKTAAGSGTAVDGVRREIAQLDPLVPVTVATLASHLERGMSAERLLAALSTFFAIVALVLVTVGLYGVMAFWVAERTTEIGVRLALGASPRRVLWTVLRQPLRFVMLGGAIGGVAALVASRLVEGLVFGVAPRDPLTIAGAGVILAIAALLAGYGPARRAARVDPLVALRNQ